MNLESNFNRVDPSRVIRSLISDTKSYRQTVEGVIEILQHEHQVITVTITDVTIGELLDSLLEGGSQLNSTLKIAEGYVKYLDENENE